MKIFHLPDLGEGLAEAEIREWYVNPGDEVTVDQPLASMETAKAVVDVPSPYAGKIVTLHGNQNDVIKTGAPLVTFQTNDSVASEDKGSVVGALLESSQKWNEGHVQIGSAKKRSASHKAMPAARALATQLNIDLQAVKGTGPQGLITVQDVQQFHDVSTSALKGHETESLHGVRKAMAQAMALSHREVSAVTISEDADLTQFPKNGDLTVAVIKAIIAAAKEEAALNAWFDGKNLERKLFSEVHLGLAVDTPEGLFVPVIKHAETLSDNELRDAINKYKKGAQERSIAPSDFHGATFTLSNFGSIAGRYATPVVIPPTVAILGSGKMRDVPLVKNGEVVIGRIMPLSLTFDHRAATGGEATRFLSAVIRYLEACR